MKFRQLKPGKQCQTPMGGKREILKKLIKKNRLLIIKVNELVAVATVLKKPDETFF